VFDFVFRGADDRNFTIIPRDMPILLVGGQRDPATDGGKAVEKLAARMRAMGFSNLQSTIYAHTRHESLNEINRDIVTADFADWARGAVA
jgi:alpha-beta hydrolase superfamily lysophospholipase